MVDNGIEIYTIVYMALSIKDPEADRLARELSRSTGESLTQVVVIALRQRVERVRRSTHASTRREKLRALRESMRSLPVLDNRSEEEIIGYDAVGSPELW